MKEYLDKTCKIHIAINGKDLFYTARIINVSDTHITFVDKFNETLTFRLQDIIEIRGIIDIIDLVDIIDIIDIICELSCILALYSSITVCI